MSKEVISLVVWTGLFLLFELPAHFVPACPWYTLSNTVWKGETWWWPISLFVLGFTMILLGHLELHWSARWLIAAGLFGAALVVSRGVEMSLR